MFKDILKRDIEEVKKNFNNRSGRELVRNRVNILDKMVVSIFKNNFSDGREAAVVAFGSLARRVTCPYSDIDVLILTKDKSSKKNVENFVKDLWDTGVTIGHSVRTINETIDLSLKDVTILTTLADARLLAGNRKLFSKFMKEVDEEVFRRSKVDAFGMMSKDRKERYAKNSSLTEPNVRDSAGGLRDFNYIFWLSKFIWGQKKPPIDIAGLRKSHDFILKTRIALHILSRRKEDRLVIDVQEDIAKIFSLDIKDFMKKLYTSMLKIKVYTDIVEEFAKKLIYPSPPELSYSMIGNYISDGEYLKAEAFGEKWRIVEVFKILKEHSLKLSPETSLLILNSNVAGLYKDRKAQEIFYEIISKPSGVEKTLTLMNELGVLKEIIPEFKKCFRKYQPYPPHIYPSDVHSIACAGEIERFLLGDIPQDFSVIRDAISEIENKDILILAGFLHDIGKGIGKNHAEKGAKMAERIGKRMGIKGIRLENLILLVKNHLVISNFSQRRDIHDKNILYSLAGEFKDKEVLDSLFVLSVADAVTTNPKDWSSWKSSVMVEFYKRMSEILRLGEFYIKRVQSKAESVKLWLRKELTGIFPKVAIDGFLENVSSRFLTSYEYDRLFRYACIFLKSYITGEPCADFAEKSEGFIEFVTTGKNEVGHFAKCTGTFFINGLNILGAYAEGEIMGNSLNIFWVEPNDVEKAERVAEVFPRVVKGEIELKREVQKRKDRFHPHTIYPRRKNPVRIVFDNSLSKEYTIMEVYCYDRLGLLYDISSLISSLDIDILFAKISTRADQVADVFYLRKNGKRVEDEEILKRLKSMIEKAVS